MSLNITSHLPTKGHDLVAEMTCYSLPFGAIGFISHLLTGYTIICTSMNRRPLWPSHRLTSGRWDFFLAVGGILVSPALAIYTFTKCRNTWQLLTIGVWGFTLSFLNGVTAVTVSWTVWNEMKGAEDIIEGSELAGYYLDPKEVRRDHAELIDIPLLPVILSTFLYAAGTIVGMTGLISLMVRAWSPEDHRLYWLTVGFGILAGLIVVCIVLGGKDEHFPQVFFVFMFPLFSDWILGLLTGNLVGTPSSTHAGFYWGYFIGKRLATFNW
ncbi:hypothetical protein BDN72DRAFT_901093 [Pluteus cervinus]|uniref:Uncharacterized protein n=1 Tax=Pluteus cervinus TaxID=181527 RepID=A0ACD3AHE9_9AGAR|nr:hypothetical protein BDN72DRAFT_901093 [Pluteus cervinus]